MQEWENTLGARPLWSLEKEALFDRLYLRFQDDAGGFLLPVEGMILQEVATQTAYDALVVKGIPADTLDGLMVGVSLYRVQMGKDATQDTWNISYYNPVPDADGVFKEVGVATVDAYDGTLVNVIVMNPDSKG